MDVEWDSTSRSCRWWQLGLFRQPSHEYRWIYRTPSWDCWMKSTWLGCRHWWAKMSWLKIYYQNDQKSSELLQFIQFVWKAFNEWRFKKERKSRSHFRSSWISQIITKDIWSITSFHIRALMTTLYLNLYFFVTLCHGLMSSPSISCFWLEIWELLFFFNYACSCVYSSREKCLSVFMILFVFNRKSSELSNDDNVR